MLSFPSSPSFANIYIDARGNSKAERFTHFGEIKLVDVKNLFQRVGGVGLKIGPESIARRGVQVEVILK